MAGSWLLEAGDRIPASARTRRPAIVVVMSSLIPASVLRAAYQLFTTLRPRSAQAYPGDMAASAFRGGQADALTPACDTEIPRRIWSYWNTRPDTVVQQCIANWRTQCPDYEIHVLNSGNLAQYVPPEHLPLGFAQLHPTKQSDWLRLYLVHHHGGYWLDATTLLTQPLDWLDAARRAQGAEFAGFFLEGFTRNAAYPVVESWIFGAPAHAPFMAAWQQEFHRALIEQGTAAYLQVLRATPHATELLQGIADPEYLLIHVAAQQVLRRDNPYRLALFKAEDTAFFHQKAVGWKWYWLYPRLCLMAAREPTAPLIKLRGGERRHFAALLELHGGPAPGSLWQRACAGR